MDDRNDGYKLSAMNNTNRTIQASVRQDTVKNSPSLSTSQETTLSAWDKFVVTRAWSEARRVTIGGEGALPGLRFTYRPGDFLLPSFSTWGRVVADIPDFNRELVAVLAEG